MVRLYPRMRIHELEDVFNRSFSDPVVLKLLRAELRRRSSEEAGALLEQVEVALGSLASASGNPGQVDGHPAVNLTPPGRPESPGRAEASGSVAAAEAPAAPAASELLPVPTPDPERLLAAWSTLEVLEPQPVPDPRTLADGQKLLSSEEHPEPWTEPRYRRRKGDKGVCWWVYLGELKLSEALESLLKQFPDDSPEKPPRVRGTTTMGAVVLDEHGRPVQGKTFVASFPWGYGKVLARKLHKLSGFPAEEQELFRNLEQHLTRYGEDGQLLPVTPEVLDETTEWLIETLGLPQEQVRTGSRFLRVVMRSEDEDAPEPDLLNSFYLEDLSRVRAAWKSGDAGTALKAFLTGEPSRGRQDVVRDQALLDRTLAPARIPPVRWPVRGRYPLVTMQQAAVNHAVGELSTPGLVGINGPPGTGKTTLLRDVVARVVLERALALAEFEDPEKAFSPVARLSAGRGFFRLSTLDDSLVGHEIVVASTNNKAVENISEEIPSSDAVAEDLEPPLRYFAGIAEAVFGDPAAGGEPGCWGLAAAKLGNSSNRRQFFDAFWWDEERSIDQYLRGITEGWSPIDESEQGTPFSRPEILALEGAPRDRYEALERWKQARQEFRTALGRVERRRQHLEAVREALGRLEEVEAALGRLAREVRALREKVEEAETSTRRAEWYVERMREACREAKSERRFQHSLRPGFFARLFGSASHREWRRQMQEETERVRQARKDERSAEELLTSWRRQLETDRAALGKGMTEQQLLENRRREIRDLLAPVREELGQNLPDGEFWSKPEEARQKLYPWLEDEFQRGREDLFAVCFRLHKAFIDAAAQPLRHNLGAVEMLLKGKGLSEEQEPARRSLWASLFLVVPVVSTTFASFDRMFGALGRESLGWLLIDEAGQAVPQAAAGAIWRSQRVIGIGDPMQIPPVVTLPQRLIDAIFQEYGQDADHWSAPRNSVQVLADRASWLGTELRHEQGSTWVGAPLRVHRRCEEPMFGISNRVAYGGTMVQATPPGESEIGRVLGESGWFHVDGEGSGHWSAEEGELAAELLTRLLRSGQGDPDVFFITPFRTVQENLRRRLRKVIEQHTSLRGWPWVQERVGTIHVFQGKEAEAVVLVLGAPSAQARGARWWAGETPNLLNVAVSRAKRRLYVVGNREAWRDAGVFKALAERLPTREGVPL